MAGGRCRDICVKWVKKKRPYIMPFLTHSYCRLCEVWFEKKKLSDARCKCCRNILAIKPRINQNKRKYNAVMNTVEWKKIHVPVKKSPFGDHVDKIGEYK